MDLRTIALATAAVAALSPAISAANPTDTAMSACVQAFAAKITPPGTETPAVKVAYPQQHAAAATVMDYYARNYSFTMSARKVKSGAEFAQATCLADARGVVLSFHTNN